MKSLNITLILVAAIGGLAAAFQTGRSTVKTDPPAPVQTAVAPPQLEPEKEPPQIGMINVVIAKKDLAVGTLLYATDFEGSLDTMRSWKEAMPPDVICNVEELKNKRLIRTLKAGSYFCAADVQEDRGVKIPDGMYQYAIALNQIVWFQAGDHVDVILTEPIPDKRPRSGMVLRHVLVLAVHTELNNSYSASVAVTSEQALTLASCEKRGEVNLVLRDPKNR